MSHCLISFLFGHAQWQRTNGDTTNDRTNKQKKREMGKKEAEIRQTNRKKRHIKTQTSLFFVRWFVVCRFFMSSESPCPCIHMHTDHYCHGILVKKISFMLLVAFELYITALLHATPLYCVVNGSRYGKKTHTKPNFKLKNVTGFIFRRAHRTCGLIIVGTNTDTWVEMWIL